MPDYRRNEQEAERHHIMEELEENRARRERRALHSAGSGSEGAGGMMRRDPYRQEGGRPLRGGRPGFERDYGHGYWEDGPGPLAQPSSQGSHRGRGPRGYRRSDARIAEDVNDRLTEDRHLDATGIEVSVNAGEVTLTGNVDSRAARRRAEDTAEGVSGVTYVMNNLRVRQAGPGGATG